MLNAVAAFVVVLAADAEPKDTPAGLIPQLISSLPGLPSPYFDSGSAPD